MKNIIEGNIFLSVVIYKFILFATVSAILLSIPPVFAYEITYDFNGTKLLKNPTVCGYDLDDETIPKMQKERIL